jgi:hypothetical protein
MYILCDMPARAFKKATKAHNMVIMGVPVELKKENLSIIG